MMVSASDECLSTSRVATLDHDSLYFGLLV